MSGTRVKLQHCNVDPDRQCVRLFDSDAPSLGRIVGHVRPVFLDSHIRRGRLQASPHWQASDVDAKPLDVPQQLRRDAVDLVVRSAT